MAIDLKIGGVREWNTSAYSVAEDSTPLDPSDMTGGVGQFTISIPSSATPRSINRKVVDLADGSQGITQGIARGASDDDQTITFTADSRLVALNAVVTAAPFVGTLENALRYYFGLVGLTADISIDTTISGTAVVFPGWGANAWDQIKKLCASLSIEVSLASNVVVARPVRGRIAETTRIISKTRTLDDAELAQAVQGMVYNNVSRTGALAYPLGGWSESTPIIQVAAGETMEVEIALAPGTGDTGLGVSLSAITQPTCVAFVDRYHSSSSVYAIVGNDGLPVAPQAWLDGGGSVTVSIGADTRSIVLKVVGSRVTKYAPFRLAMSAGTSDFYSSLRLVGNGVFFNKEVLTMSTGLDAVRAPTELAPMVDCEFLSTYEQTFRGLVWTLARYSAPKQSVTVSATGINRAGETGSYRYPKFSDFNAQYAGMTMGDFNALWAGMTMADFNEAQLALVQGDFDNQAFGNVAGARLYDNGAWYRIRSVPSITPSFLSFTAERDTLMGDFNTVYAGMTMGQFNALHVGETMADFNIAPLIVS